MNCTTQSKGKNWAMYNGDCCDLIKAIPSESIGYSVFSPPFADLFTYSDLDRDMGNCASYEDFFDHFRFLADELFRVIAPGRSVSLHCMDLTIKKQDAGYIGSRDFPGDLLRMMLDCGFIYHSRVCVWKCPLTAATRTKALGLMHKQLKKDSAISRQGLPDYILTVRKPGDNAAPIAHPDGFTEYHGGDDPGGHGDRRSQNIWRRYASPVWHDIRQTHTLNIQQAREDKDEKHICPLQLDVVERCTALWSTEGDIVLSPFAGIGSEGYVAVKNNRRFIGFELKPQYYQVATSNLGKAENLLIDGDLITAAMGSIDDDL